MSILRKQTKRPRVTLDDIRFERRLTIRFGKTRGLDIQTRANNVHTRPVRAEPCKRGKHKEQVS